MGVPKFYRWISERYPCLSQVVKEYQIPEFDNLYLDMNGIIHTCSHPNDEDATFRITEDKIFCDIFRYLEVLFRIAKPQKVLFLAVDGVAPRAKMNQQRGRRFRSAREAEDLVRKAVAKGTVLPKEERFDSNSITPGTEFMARLHEQLKYFINKKLATDPAWQKVDVILSGHCVPGEGEHKIMDYIRYQKAQPGYDPNTRHCLYGLDADLIMLGLVTHEPHFCLLREEVQFGKKAKRQTSPDTITFHLLHLSILREYIDYEFSSVKESLQFTYDLEAIIDDWVLMGYLVGNDFIPSLPNMHIKQEILPFLYKKYADVLPSLGGYINNNGTLNMARFEKYLAALAKFDYDHFSELISNSKWMESKSSHRHQVEEELGLDSLKKDPEAIKKLQRDLGIKDLKSYFADEDSDREDNFETEMMQHKQLYYQRKMGFASVDEQVLHEQAKCYAVGVQWVLHYYYTGVPSWSWFYPYHYAPFVSDIKGISNLQLEFEQGEPFLPFQQLLAVLPAASRFLLPKPYQGLMVNEDSPLIDFYPTLFETDLNGKQHEWEAVVVIPFIDEDQLLAAMTPLAGYLSKEETLRNAHGSCLLYKYNRQAPNHTYPSPWPTQFPDIVNCKVDCKDLFSDPFPIKKEDIVHGLLPQVSLDVYFPGFPTLKHIPHKAHLKLQGVQVFQSVSRGESMCITILPRKDFSENIALLAEELIGKTCYVGWPYLVEAKVSGLSDGKTSYYYEKISEHSSRLVMKEEELQPQDVKRWKRDVEDTCRMYNRRRGINLGEVRLIVYAQELQGMQYILNRSGPKGSVSLIKQWSQSTTFYPLQTVVKDIYTYAPEYRESVKTLEELYEVGDLCFLFVPTLYGEQAEITSVDMQSQRIHVKLKVQQEPMMDTVLRKYNKLQIHYLPINQMAKRLGMPILALTRITASLLCERGSPENKKEREKFNLGLNLKFSQRNQELVGYARKTQFGWSLSQATEELMLEYRRKFPSVVSYIAEHPSQDRYYEVHLFPESNGGLQECKEWLKSLPVQNAVPVECGSWTLNTAQINEVQSAIDLMKKTCTDPGKTQRLKVKPSMIFKPTDHQGGLIPDLEASYQLLDRVVNVSKNCAVPFGLRGTVIRISGDESEYEVLYDDQFLGGLSIRGSRSTAYRHPPSCLINLSKRTHPTARTHNMAPFYQQSPDVRRNECTIVNTSGRLTAYNRHAAGTHSTQQHHVQQVLSRTEPLRTSSATGKCLSSNPSVTVVTRKGDQHTTHKPKNDQIKGSSAAASDFNDLLSCIQKGPDPHPKSDQNLSNSSLAYQKIVNATTKPESTIANVTQSSPVKPSPSLAEAAEALSKLTLSSSCSAPYTALKTKDKVVESSSVVAAGSTEKKSPSKRFAPSVAAIFSAASSEHPSGVLPRERSVRKVSNDDTPQQPPPRAMQDKHNHPAVMLHRPPLLCQPISQGYLPSQPSQFSTNNPVSDLYAVCHKMGLPKPIFSTSVKSGIWTSSVTVGKMMYNGVQTPFKQKAMESAALVAHNALPYPPPMLQQAWAPFPHLPPNFQYPSWRFAQPQVPYMYQPGVPVGLHPPVPLLPRPPLLPHGPSHPPLCTTGPQSMPPLMIPTQVQRLQGKKFTSNKVPVESPPKSSTVSVFSSSARQHVPDTGSASMLTTHMTDSDNSDKTNLLDRLQTAAAEYQQVEEKMSKLNKLVHKVGAQDGVHDPLIMAALEQQGEEGELMEAIPVSDSVIGSDVCVVGEVVAASAN